MTDGNGLPPIIGESPGIKRAVELAQRFAPTDLPILLVGATGTGKELLAQQIHRWSGRPRELVDVNCAALPEHLAESELFGHDGQAFTGARRAKTGLIEAADGTTLFLDEVPSLPVDLQAKLLRVLETQEVRRVGETAKRRVHVRWLAAAQDDLAERVATRTFREDLYQRLAGVVLRLPRLADRLEDIITLARYLAGLQGRALAPEAERLLLGYAWPGNVRELRHVIARASQLVANGMLPAAAIAEAIRLGGPVARGGSDEVAGSSRAACERAELVLACESHGWNADRIAGALGIHRGTLFRRLKRAGLSLRGLRQSQSREQSRDSVRPCDWHGAPSVP